MDDEVQVPEVPEVPDTRRDVIEQAFEAAEQAAAPTETAVDSAPVTETKTDVTVADVPAATAATTAKVDAPKTEQTTAHEFPVDKAPQAWRAPQKAKWAALDPEVRQEVVRREREITKTLGESAQARQFAQQFYTATQPFQARLQSMGAHPIAAVKELLQADYILSSAPAPTRAAFMAKLIKDYDIDIGALDTALAGTTEPPDPVATKVEELLQQRLAPFAKYMEQQRQREAQSEQQTNQQISLTIEQMAADPKYPHFQTLREDMADLIDIAAKRGQFLTLEQAYTRAIGMNPEVSQQVAAQQSTEAKRTAAQRNNAAAQRALAASVSVGGAPNAQASGTSVPGNDRRAAIEAAFDSIGGR